MIIDLWDRDASAFNNFFIIGYKWYVFIFLSSIFIGFWHWFVLFYDDFTLAILKLLKAQRLREDDPQHRMFRCILDEVSVAIGGRKIKGYVIPFSSINVFGIENFQGRAIIGITDGALSRLNRAQIEAAVAHEAAHIATGDCLSTAVATAVAGLYYRLWGIGFLGAFILRFISRERDYRADAIAVRLTRNPISLAEALYKMVYDSSARIAIPELAGIFIIDPTLSGLDETMGLNQNLFSIHPPIPQRIKILLEMAHIDYQSFERSLEREIKKFNEAERFQQETNPLLKEGFPGNFQDNRALLGSQKKLTGEPPEMKCPRCSIPLEKADYEGLPLLRCSHCQGCLIDSIHESTISQREVGHFSQRIIELARIRAREGVAYPLMEGKGPDRFLCPQCQSQCGLMHRTLYDDYYPVEVDKCSNCGLVWFDKDELEVLQYLVEGKAKGIVQGL